MNGGDAYAWCLGQYRALLDGKTNSVDNVQRRGILLFLDLLSGIECAHQRGVFSRDIKLENMLLYKDAKTGALHSKLADLGVATTDVVSRELRHGTMSTMAPEVLIGAQGCDAYSPELADRWSLGIVLFNLLTGLAPWSAADPDLYSGYAYYKQNASSLESSADALHFLVASAHCPNLLNFTLARIIAGLLQIDPIRRTTLASVRGDLEAYLTSIP